jgi:hypothetical protein
MPHAATAYAKRSEEVKIIPKKNAENGKSATNMIANGKREGPSNKGCG